MEGILPVIVATVAALVVLGGVLLVLARCYVKVPSGQALLIQGSRREPLVTFGAALVPPIVSHGELVDCSSKVIVVRREGKNAIRCHDKIRVSIHAELRVRVRPVSEDVRRAARSLGAARTFDTEAVAALFSGKFADALATVIAHFDYDALIRDRDEVRDKVILVIGTDLEGFQLDDLALVEIAQVPVEMLDRDDIHDAEAIRTITERTGAEHARTMEIKRHMREQEAQARLHEAELDLIRAQARGD